MATQIEVNAQPRVPLSRERVLRAAVALGDEGGVESLSMRKIAHELGVVPMALYKHVSNKDEMLNGMVDVVVGEIDHAPSGTDWKTAIRQRVLSARSALLRHPWASRVIESRTSATPAVLAYMDSMIGILRAGGFSIDLTHHAMHAMGSRLLGFTQELFDDTADVGPETEAEMLRVLADTYPHITEMVMAITHDEESVVGRGCDDQFEFEFALDLMLDGLERLRDRDEPSSGGALRWRRPDQQHPGRQHVLRELPVGHQRRRHRLWEHLHREQVREVETRRSLPLILVDLEVAAPRVVNPLRRRTVDRLEPTLLKTFMPETPARNPGRAAPAGRGGREL